MRKFLVGVILGALVAGNANASIISRSFLDEALTDYATNTALDLKANQSDFTELNTQISDSVDVLRQLLEQGGYSYEFVNFINPEKFPNTISGAFSLLYQYLESFAGSIWNGWTDSNGNWVFGLRDITEDYYNTTRADIRKLYDGWDAGNNTSYLGVIGLNDKIGTLPEGITVQGMYEGWTQDDRYHPGLSMISDYVSRVEDAYGVRFPFVFTQGSRSTKIDGVDYTGPVYPLWKLSEGIAWPEDLVVPGGVAARQLFQVDLTDIRYPEDATAKDVLEVLFRCNGSPGSSDACFDYMADSILYGTGLSKEFASLLPEHLKDLTRHKGLLELTKDIGTLPEGITVQGMYEGWTQDDRYHPGLSMISDYVSKVEDAYGVRFPFVFTQGSRSTKIDGVDYTGPVYSLWKLSEEVAKIGTLPSGNFREFPGYDLLFPWLNQPYTYPTSLAELITAIYGNSETGQMGLLEGIIAGFGIDTDGDGQFDSNIGTLSNYNLAKNAIDLANANATKIGDLPTEYATVGAALTAMESDIDAKNLPSTSDDGQYVLSAKKVGDTITYTWVRMDLTSEEQAQ